VSVYRLAVPLVFIHAVMPWFFTFGAIPLYFMASALVTRYWNTMAPLRRLAAASTSRISGFAASAAQNSLVFRAYGVTDCAAFNFAILVDHQVRADLMGGLVLRQWLATRLLLLWSFFVTCVALVGLWFPDIMGPGTLGLCLTNCMLVLNTVDSSIEAGSEAQFALISLGRLEEYLQLPQEPPAFVEDDDRYRSLLVEVKRSAMGDLFHDRDAEGMMRVGRRGGSALLQETLNKDGLEPCLDVHLSDLCPNCAELEGAHGHRIVAVNDSYRDPAAIAEELCRSSGDEDEEVWLEIQSNWAANGAKVAIEGLKVGYVGVPRDVLKGITVSVEPRQRVCIVGITGCGKSTLLLALLRILEPKSGSVLINNVNINSLGLATLRWTVGLVPENPVLLSGSLRSNVDPFGMYPESRIRFALRAVNFQGGDGFSDDLDVPVGTGLSLGQRQLLAMARMVVRQPSLLLLDEAISAVDLKTQDAARTAVGEAFPRSTVIAVLNRFEVAVDFDQVLVMDHGDIVEKGSPKDLAYLRNGAMLRGVPRIPG